MQGVLFRYGPAAPHIAFQSGSAHRHLVLVAGLTEGVLCLPYVEALAAEADRAGYSLVQAQMRSSYQGWGVGSLDDDADDLLLLSGHLRSSLGSRGMVLMGHSTGCQDAVRFCARHAAAGGGSPLEGVILQAPVSDREWLSHFYPGVIELLPEARRMVEAGRGDYVITRGPEDLGGAPISARRLVALAARLGDDDMWSTDLTLDELCGLLGHMRGRPLLLLQSGADECVADAAGIPELGRRVVEAIEGGPATSGQVRKEAGGGGGGAAAASEEGRAASVSAAAVGGGSGVRHVVLAGAPHNASGNEAALAGHVGEFLRSLHPPG